jgi:hypothetical protein
MLLIITLVCITSMSIYPKGNRIGDTGATSLGEELKSNTTLSALDLSREDKERRHTKDIHQQLTLFFSSSHKQTTTLETQEQRH